MIKYVDDQNEKIYNYGNRYVFISRDGTKIKDKMFEFPLWNKPFVIKPNGEKELLSARDFTFKSRKRMMAL